MNAGFVFFVAVSVALGGCKQGQRPVLQAQFCLAPQDARELERIFRAIARDEGMDFFRRGSQPEKLEVAAELNESGSTLLLPHGFEMAVRSADDFEGFSAAITGYPSNQVSMGFSAGRDRRVALAFAKRVVARLREKWDVRLVSGEVGMFPLKDCP